MASTPPQEPVDAAEKAYAAAAESLIEKPATKEVVAAPTEPPAADASLPPKPRRATKALPAAAKVAAPVAKARPAAKKKPAVKAKKPAAPRPATARSAALKPAVAKAAKPVIMLKDKIMATTTKEFTETVKSALADMQAKAKEGMAKGSELVSEAVEFAKGNVEAVVEAGKILVEGTKKLGEAYVAEAKDAYETVNADIKSMAAVKSPVELVKLQGEIATRNFEQAIELTKKNSEAWMKLASEAFAPIQGRFSLVVEKIKKAA